MIFKLKNNLSLVRKNMGLTQIQLADLCNTTRNTISNIETGLYSPTAYTAALICKFLNCTFEDIFYLECVK